MERTEVLAMMGELRLFGMKNAHDEVRMLMTRFSPPPSNVSMNRNASPGNYSGRRFPKSRRGRSNIR